MPQEIERKYLLDGLPRLPDHAEPIRIEQGYLPRDEPHPAALHTGGDREPVTPEPDVARGRLRRSTHATGEVICEHTIKEGIGLVREEIERDITPEQFERHWPRTAGRRLVKTRHRVPVDDRVWEIDVFEGIDLVLAEVELPAADATVVVPSWLRPHIVREVTDDPAFRNYEIARRAFAPAAAGNVPPAPAQRPAADRQSS